MRQAIFRAGFKTLQTTGLSRVLAPMTQGCGAVFMMHHVRPGRADAFQPNRHLEITPDFLRATVKQIRSAGYEILALDEAVDLLKAGYGRKRYAVLTFDDGYRDNLTEAYPILQALNAPFTVYVATGLIDRSSELWWLALERIVAENSEIRLMDGEEGEGIPCGTVEEKVQCFEKLCGILTQELGEREQRAVIRDLCARYGVDLAALADATMMSWDEIRQLAADPLVTLAAHTHDHFALARLDADDARADIQRGIARMEAELGRRPKHFAYPYGKPHSVCDRDAETLQSMGFLSAVTTMPGVLLSVNARAPLRLPRVSLNGCFQDPAVVDQYLTGVPFAAYRAARWIRSGFGLRT